MGKKKKKKGKKKKHVFYDDPQKLHKPGCVSSHQSKYVDGDACSYRWQGVKQAEAHPSPYNQHSKPYARIGGESLYTTGHFANLAQSGTGNFHNGYMPYANQVHHVLPRSVLLKGVEKTAKSATQIETVRDGLLYEEYNLNYQENMIILAVRWRDACQIGLPTHCGDHPAYSATILSGVMKALSGLAELLDQGVNHEDECFEDIRKELEQISTDTYPTIVSYGQTVIKGRCKAEEITVDDLANLSAI